MNKTTGRLLYWTPRLLCIAFAAFLSIFAMDVFDLKVDFLHKMLALAMHLIPTALVLVALIVVWRWEWIGALVFPGLAAFHLATVWSRHLHWSAYALIDGPLVLLGVLFLMNWLNRATLRPATK